MSKFEFKDNIILLDGKEIKYVTDMVIEARAGHSTTVHLDIVIPPGELCVEDDDVNVKKIVTDLFPPKPSITTRFFRKLMS